MSGADACGMRSTEPKESESFSDEVFEKFD